MRINLKREEVTQILRERFADEEAIFSVDYIESDNAWEATNNRKIQDMVEPPIKQSFLLFFD